MTTHIELVITRGLPGSGKTTFARDWVAMHRADRARINRDDLRQMMDAGEFVKGETEQRILAVRNSAIEGLLRRGISVVCDDTNLPNRVCRDLADLAARCKADFRIEDFTTVPLDTCIARDEMRKDKKSLSDGIIAGMHMQYLRGHTLPLEFTPTPAHWGNAPALYEPDEELPLAFLCDIDGTVALKGDRSPFDETRVHKDRPNSRVIEVVENHIKLGYQPIFLSGRTMGCYSETWNWLADNIRYDELNAVNDYGVVEKLFRLIMRPIGDNRKDSIVKRELFDQHVRREYNVRFVLDDRDQVVKMWREELGLSCLQVAPGNF